MAKHKYIETPEKLWELFEAYRKEVKSNPKIIYEYHGKDGEERQKPLERPLILEGFYCYCAEKIGSVHQYFKNQDQLYNEYMPIITRIKEEIRQDQIVGGMVGMYNSNLTARLNGLREQTETNTNTTIKLFNIDPLTE